MRHKCLVVTVKKWLKSVYVYGYEVIAKYWSFSEHCISLRCDMLSCCAFQKLTIYLSNVIFRSLTAAAS